MLRARARARRWTLVVAPLAVERHVRKPLPTQRELSVRSGAATGIGPVVRCPLPGGFMRIPQPLGAAVLTLALLAPLPRAAPAQAPTRVTGQVQDSATGRPMRYARVLVLGTAVGTVTDANGRFVLDVPAGRDSLSFKSLGYKPVLRGVEAVVNVVMQPQAM